MIRCDKINLLFDYPIPNPTSCLDYVNTDADVEEKKFKICYESSFWNKDTHKKMQERFAISTRFWKCHTLSSSLIDLFDVAALDQHPYETKNSVGSILQNNFRRIKLLWRSDPTETGSEFQTHMKIASSILACIIVHIS